MALYIKSIVDLLIEPLNYSPIQKVCSQNQCGKYLICAHTRTDNKIQSFFHQEAEKNGFQRVHEIFYHVSAGFNSACHLGCLYDIGFRLVETEHFWGKSTQNNCCHLFVYRPSLIPDFQVENGTLPGQIKTDIIGEFLKELLTSTGHIKNGFNASDVEKLQTLIENLENASEVFVKSSFPLHGV